MNVVALRRVPPADLLAAAYTFVLATVVEVAVRVLPIDRLCALLGVPLAGRSSAPAPPPGAALAEPPVLSPGERRACRAVDRVMRRWPGDGGTCLREALLYGHALRRRSPCLHVGAGLDDGRPLAHAWLSFEGVAVGARVGMLELTVDGA